MTDHTISIDNARENLLSCALFMTENISSVEARAAAMNEIIGRLLAQDKVDLAAELADSLEDPFARNRLLTQVISKCVEMDDLEYAFQLIEAIDEFGMQSRAREVIALRLAKQGEFEKASEIAADLDHSSDAFAGIAVYQTQAGRHAEAAQTLEKIDFPGAKIKALIAAAVYFFERGEKEKTVEFLDSARRETAEVEFTQEKIGLLLEISMQMIRAGAFEKASEVLNEASVIIEKLETVQKDHLFVSVAVGFLKAGDVEAADRTLDLVTDKTQMASCLLAFSQEFAEEKDFEEAVDALEESYAILKSQSETEVRSTKERFRLFGAIAAQFASLDKFERAIEIAQENIDREQKNLALSKIAQIAALKDENRFVEQALQAFGDESSRLNALIAISDVKKGLNKPDEALKILDEAQMLVETVEQLIVRTEVENGLAARYFQSGEPEKARLAATKSLRTIEKIKGDENRAYALAQLSEIYEKFEFVVTEEDRNILDNMVKTSEFS